MMPGRNAGEADPEPEPFGQVRQRTIQDRKMRMNYARNTLFFCIVTLVLSYGAYRRWGQPDRKNIELAHVAAHADDYNVLFFGSSISQGNIDPLTFDRLMGQRGFQSRSFTLGMGSADMHQIDWAIRAVLRSEPKNLKYVFVELRDFDAEIRRPYQYTTAAIRWHDAHQLTSALRTVDVSALSPRLKKQARRIHWSHFFLKYVPAGAVFAAGLGASEEKFDPTLRGYLPYDTSDRDRARQRREFLKNLDWYLGLVESRRRGDYEEVDLETFNMEALRAQAELIRAAGATPVYWTGPSLNDYSFAMALAGSGFLTDGLFFHDAARFPELFEPDLRLDYGHLNHEGTQIFMPLLVEKFLESQKGVLDLPAFPGDSVAVAGHG